MYRKKENSYGNWNLSFITFSKGILCNIAVQSSSLQKCDRHSASYGHQGREMVSADRQREASKPGRDSQ